MKRIYIYAVVALTLSTVGCNTLNNNFNTYPPGSTNPPPSDWGKEDVPETAVVDSNKPDARKDAVCPPFVFPAPTKTPPLPYKEIAAAGNSASALELVERKHIDDLRAYISKLKNDMSKAQLVYAAECNRGNKQQ